jgi:hypothetical protein
MLVQFPTVVDCINQYQQILQQKGDTRSMSTEMKQKATTRDTTSGLVNPSAEQIKYEFYLLNNNYSTIHLGPRTSQSKPTLFSSCTRESVMEEGFPSINNLY